MFIQIENFAGKHVVDLLELDICFAQCFRLILYSFETISIENRAEQHLNFLREIFAIDTNICFVHNSPGLVSLGMYFSGIPSWIYEFSSPYLVYLFSVQFFRQDGGTTFTNRLQLLNLGGKYCYRFGTLECGKNIKNLNKFIFYILV